MPMPTVTIDAVLDLTDIWSVDTPLGLWRLAGSSGAANIADSSGNNYHMRAVGGITWTNSGPLDDNTFGATFNGSTGYLTRYLATGTAADIGLFNGVAFSVNCYAKWTDATANQTLGGRFNGTSTIGWRIRTGAAGVVVFEVYDLLSANLVTLTSGTALNDGDWHLITAVFTTGANNCKLYADAVQEAQGTTASFMDDQSALKAVWSIGAACYGTGPPLNGPHNFFNGQIGPVALYSGTALSLARVQAHYAAGHWTTLADSDVRTDQGVSLSYGMADGLPQTRVARAGELRIALNNTSANSGGVVGYYSPNHASHRVGFRQNIPMRAILTYGGTSYYKFVGRITDINPLPGLYAKGSTACTVRDYMDTLARTNVNGIEGALNQRSDQGLTTLIAAMPQQPTATSFGTGQTSFPYIFVGAKNDTVNALQEVIRLTTSEWGYTYVKGDTSTGGIITHINRYARIQNITSLTTLADTDLTAIQVPTAVMAMINRALVTVHSRSGDTSNVVLFTSVAAASAAPPLIGPGLTIRLICPYTDPSMRASSVSGVSMVTPVATTDYTANSAADGSGSDLTSSITITFDPGGTSATLDIKNTHASQAAYLTKLQLRGLGLYDYDAPLGVSDNLASQGTYGVNPLSVDMTYQSDPITADGVAQYITTAWANPFAFVTQATFTASDTATLLTAALAREIGDRVTISETVTGVNAECFINGIVLTIQPGGQSMTCSWILAPADPVTPYWLLGTAGYTELDTTTVLWPF